MDEAVDYLKDAGMEVELFEGVEPDPSVETVMKGAEAMRKFQPDWIVAMGGGSPIDAAKAMWALLMSILTPHLKHFAFRLISQNCVRKQNSVQFLLHPVPLQRLLALPCNLPITRLEKNIRSADVNITPDVAIVDPELVMGLPIKQVAYTGMDALTHAIEAYVSTLNCPFTDPLALQAIGDGS